MQNQRRVGSATEQQHLDKMLRDYDNLPEDIKKSLDQTLKERKLSNYIPHPLFQNAYRFFWKLRNTKSYENPINYTDIKDLMEVYKISLNIWEVETILSLQIKWYEASDKYK